MQFHYHLLCLDSNRDLESRLMVGTLIDNETEALDAARKQLAKTEPDLTVVSIVSVSEEIMRKAGEIE